MRISLALLAVVTAVFSPQRYLAGKPQLSRKAAEPEAAPAPNSVSPRLSANYDIDNDAMKSVQDATAAAVEEHRAKNVKPLP